VNNYCLRQFGSDRVESFTAQTNLRKEWISEQTG